MPLSEDKQTVETAATIVETMKGIFSTPPGFRPGQGATTFPEVSSLSLL